MIILQRLSLLSLNEPLDAGVLFYYDPYIKVPANGESTARMRCPIEKDISIINLQSHMHRRALSRG